MQEMNSCPPGLSVQANWHETARQCEPGGGDHQPDGLPKLAESDDHGRLQSRRSACNRARIRLRSQTCTTWLPTAVTIRPLSGLTHSTLRAGNVAISARVSTRTKRTAP